MTNVGTATESDRALVDRLLRGDAGAASDFFVRVSDTIWTMCKRAWAVSVRRPTPSRSIFAGRHPKTFTIVVIPALRFNFSKADKTSRGNKWFETTDSPPLKLSTLFSRHAANSRS